MALAFRLSPHPMGVIELETGRCLDINDASLKTFGFRRDEVIGQTTLLLNIWPDSHDRTRLIKRLKSERSVRNLDVPIRMKRGGLRRFLISADVVMLGKTRCLLMIGSDITEHKRAEEALSTTTQLIEDLVRTSPLAVIQLSEDGERVEMWNQAAERLLGWRANEVVGKPIPWIPPGMEEAADAIWTAVVTTGQIQHIEVERLRKDGSLVDLSLWCSAVRSDRGGSHSIAFVADITERKRMEEALRVSEDRYRVLYDENPTMYFTLATDGTVVSVNRFGAEQLGYQVEELVGRSVLHIFHKADKKAVKTGLSECLANPHRTQYWEFRKIHKDRRVIWVREAVRVAKASTGETVVLVSCEDITERKRAEEALRDAHAELERRVQERTGELERSNQALIESQERFRTFFDHAANLAFIKTVDGRYLYANRRFEEAFDFTQDHILSKTDSELFAREQADQFQANDRKVYETETAMEFEETALYTDGPHTTIAVKFPMRDKSGRIYAIGGIATDINERKQAEDRLRRSEAFTASVVDNLPNMVFVKDAKELRFVRMNKAGERLLGYSEPELLNKNDRDFFPKDQADSFTFQDRKVLDNKQLLEITEEPLTTRGGAVRILHTKKIPIVDQDGCPQYLLGISEDITDRKQAEELLRESELRFRALVERIGDVFWISDPTNHKLVYVSQTFADVWGRNPKDLYDHFETWLDAIHDDDRTRVTKDFFENILAGTYHAEYRVIRPDGSIRWIRDRGKPLGIGSLVAGVAEDITERKQAEETLHQTQRELQRSQAQLQDLASKLLAAQDSERQRIARELHDDVSQRLAALVLDVAAIEQQPSRLPQLIVKDLDPIRAQLEQLSDDVHGLAYKLHPSLLEHAGLQPAIEDQIREVTKRTGLPISLKVHHVPSSLSLDHSTCLFRVLQESLQNVVRHACATEAAVKLSGSSKGVGLSVTDNGKGFDASDKSAQHKGLGLTSMQERLRLLNGFLHVHSRPTDGTKICAWIPVEKEEA